MDKPLISVVIPTFNRGDCILEAVKTVQQQTYENLEIVVVVDGSSDGTLAILEDYKARLPDGEKNSLKIHLQENKGVSSARNEGVRRSRGGYIALLDDDDRWHREKLARQVHEVQRLAPIQSILCTSDYFSSAPEKGATEVVRCSESMSLEGQIRAGMFPPPSTWLFSRDTFDALNGFDEHLHAGEDADFVVGLRKLGVTIINVSEPLAVYTLPPQGKVYMRQVESAARTLEKHDAWRRRVLSKEQYEIIMDWYRAVLPPDLYETTVRRMRAEESRSCPNAPQFDSH